MIKPIVAAMVAALSVSTAHAAEYAFPAVEPAALRVSIKGLDLSNPRDIQTLQGRIDKAIAQSCTPHGSYFGTLAPERDCRAQLTARTSQAVAALVEKADKSRMAEF